MELSLQIANSSDIKFVFHLLVEGAKKARYSSTLKNPLEAKRAAESWILNNEDMKTGNKAEVFIIMFEDKKIGVIALASFNAFPDLKEIGVFSISAAYQKKGLARKALEILLKNLEPFDVKAKCHPASKEFANLLSTSGFIQKSTCSETNAKYFKKYRKRSAPSNIYTGMQIIQKNLI